MSNGEVWQLGKRVPNYFLCPAVQNLSLFYLLFCDGAVSSGGFCSEIDFEFTSQDGNINLSLCGITNILGLIYWLW